MSVLFGKITSPFHSRARGLDRQAHEEFPGATPLDALPLIGMTSR
jgi:hypothetical protein